MLFVIAILDFSKTRKSVQNLNNVPNMQNTVGKFQVSGRKLPDLAFHKCNISTYVPIKTIRQQYLFESLSVSFFSVHTQAERTLGIVEWLQKKLKLFQTRVTWASATTLVLASTCTLDNLYHHLIQFHASQQPFYCIPTISCNSLKCHGCYALKRHRQVGAELETLGNCLSLFSLDDFTAT